MQNNTQHDGLLVLFPGSRATSESIGLLTDLTLFDAYMVATKLRTQLPLVLCPCRRDDFLKRYAQRLEDGGIRFAVLDRAFYEAPWLMQVAATCDFGKGRFKDLNDQSIEITPQEPVLLLEGRYQHQHRNEAVEKRGWRSPKRKPRETSTTTASPEEIKPRRVVYLYRDKNPLPLCFLDNRIDYGFLGAAKQMTVLANFGQLITQLESAFGGPMDRRMVQFGYALEDEPIAEHASRRGLPFGRQRPAVTREYSNQNAVNTMSRLLFCQWGLERGWIRHRLPADISLPAAGTDRIPDLKGLL